MGLFNSLRKSEESKEMKIIDKDIGFAQDCFNLIKNLIAMETHCLNSYLSSKDEKWLKLMKEFREKRTFYLDKITSKNNGNGWCISKHLAESSMLLQELSTRYMTIDDLENAKRCAEDSGFYYEKFLEINGYLDRKAENKTSA